MHYTVVVLIVKRYADYVIDKEVVGIIDNNREEKDLVQKEDTDYVKDTDIREGIFRIHL